MNNKYNLVKLKSYNYYYIIIIILLIFLIYYYYQNNIEFYTYSMGICSQNCCSTQWKIPDDMIVKDNVDLTKYKTSNMTCNNGISNTGCVCLTPDSEKLLSNRGFAPISLGNGLLNEDNNRSGMNIFSKTSLLPINSNTI